MIVRKETKLADLISSSGLIGVSCQVAEESLRQELHRRTGTILGLQAKLDGQDAALAEAAQQQATLQEQLQELQSQLSCAPSICTSQAGDEQLSAGSSYVQQPRSNEQLAAARAAGAAAAAAATSARLQDALAAAKPTEHGPAGAARDAANAKEEYARNLVRLEASLAAAESSAATCWQAYDVTFSEVAKRVAGLLHSQCEGLALPFHRPSAGACRHTSEGGS
ncbi:hypothetical protein OEZ86_006780 [Tetradesmus obliquus]|nr:hypothetical protein OEZ86_006780 [Tetradesmus obliquus]